jgi:hypothetical protein
MPKRSIESVVKELTAERQRLDESLATLDRELLSAVPPLFIGVALGATALALVARRKPKRKRATGITIRWKFD